MAHGACDCGPVAFAPGSAVPSGLAARELASELRARAQHCKARQFVLAAYGDGIPDVAQDMRVARARATTVVTSFAAAKPRRLDTLLFAGPRLRTASTVEVLCPNAPLPPQTTF